MIEPPPARRIGDHDARALAGEQLGLGCALTAGCAVHDRHPAGETAGAIN